MHPRVVCVVLPPRRQSGKGIRCPVAGQIRDGDSDESGRPQIAGVGLDAGGRDAENDVTQIVQVPRRKWRPHAEILGVAFAARAQRTRKPPKEARPIRDVQDRKPAHHGVERAVWNRMAERVAAEMRDVPAKAAASASGRWRSRATRAAAQAP